MSRHNRLPSRSAIPYALIGGIGAVTLRMVHKYSKSSRENAELERRLRVSQEELHHAETDQAALEAKNADLENQLRHDDLTGLLNKRGLREEIEAKKQAGVRFGVIVMDLNGFKLVNDTLGHNEGDGLLQDYSIHLNEKLRREGDTIAHERLYHPPETDQATGAAAISRIGGDEFALVFDLEPSEHGGQRRNPSLEGVVDYVKSINSAFFAEAELQYPGIPLGAAVGAAEYAPESPIEISDLLGQADKNMYVDKQASGGGR